MGTCLTNSRHMREARMSIEQPHVHDPELGKPFKKCLGRVCRGSRDEMCMHAPPAAAAASGSL